MIFQSFILGNLVSLCMKIINSVVVVGLYYGFLTTFSIGPSYLFLLRARAMKEGTEKKVSATTGFITGQLMMFISIYYVPLHLALGRPHTITVLALPYLLFHFFWNNHKHFFDYRSTNRNSMRNLSIQCVFLNNLIFQLFNHFILPSSMLVRLVNIYMFRCNNKMLFVTSSFVGWLIGHIFFMKWVGLVLVWIRQNNSIRSNKYLVAALRNFRARSFSILLFITCVYYLGRIPSPIPMKETEEKEDPDKIDEREEIRVNRKKKTKDEFLFKETRYKNRPVYETYYLDVDRNQENSKLEIFKEKKDFQSKLLKRLIRKIHTLIDRKKFDRLLELEKLIITSLFDYKDWNLWFRSKKTNRFEKSITLKHEISQYFFFARQSDGKERISLTHPISLATFFQMIQRKMSLFTIEELSSDELYNNSNSKTKEKRKSINNKFLNIVKILDKTRKSKSLILYVLEKRNEQTSKSKNSKKNPKKRGWRNKIYRLFKLKKSKTYSTKKKKRRKLFIGIGLKKLKKKVIQRDSKLKEIITEFITRWNMNEKKLFRIVHNLNLIFFLHKGILYNKKKIKVIFAISTNPNKNRISSNNYNRLLRIFFRIVLRPNFRQNLLKGAIRGQSRKIGIVFWWKAFLKSFRKKFTEKKKVYKVLKHLPAAVRRGRNLLLLIQSILRQYIILPSLILVKTSIRSILRQKSEWELDVIDWKNEVHLKYSYDKLYELLKNEWPIKVFKSHIHIKIESPFRLKFWHDTSKKINNDNKNYFLNFFGLAETENIFGQFETENIFYIPDIKILFKDIKSLFSSSCFQKLFKVLLKSYCIVLINLNKARRIFFQKGLKKIKKGFSKTIRFLKNRQKIILFRLKKIEKYELSENKKEKILISNNEIIDKAFITVQSRNCTTFLLTEKKLQRITARTNTIIEEIQKILKVNKNEFISLHRNLNYKKIRYDEKMLELQKTFLQLLKKKNVRLICKTTYFINLSVNGIHTYLFFYIYKFFDIFYRRNVQLFFFEFKKKIIINYNSCNNSIYNNEKQKTDKKKKRTKTKFIYSINKALSNSSNKNLHAFCDLSYLSQTYVFYKLLQNTVFHFFNLDKDKLRSVFQSNVTYFFLKNEIKNYFIGTQTIFHSKLRHKNLRNSQRIQQWKNRLKIFYKNDLFQLVSQETRNIVNHCSIVQNKNLNKFYSYKKNRLLKSEKKKNVKKQDKYNFLAYQFIKYEDKKNSFISEIPLQVNYNQYILSNYDANKRTMQVGISVNNYLDRNFFYWLRMNEEILKFPLFNFELGLFPEFLILSNSYKKKKKSWNLSIKCIFLNFNQNGIENTKNLPLNKNNSPFNKKNLPFLVKRNYCLFEITEITEITEILKLKKINKINKNFLLLKLMKLNEILKLNKIKEINKNFLILNHLNILKKFFKKFQNKKRYNFFEAIYIFQKNKIKKLGKNKIKKLGKNKMTFEFFLFRKKLLKLNSNVLNSKAYSICIEAFKRGQFSIEPVRLSIKKKGQFIMHQTISISISVVNQSNHRINQRAREKGHIDKKNYDELIIKHQKITQNRAKTHYALFVLESSLSPRRRKEFRILIYFYSMNRRGMPLNCTFFYENYNENKEKIPVLNKNKRDTKIQLKNFLWPNYRLEDFVCLNRYWFDTNNGSRFGMLRVPMYPQLKK
uniref:Protein TIC 214 n=1 Tax=Elatostema laevissimum var. laevissimum TaxID=2306674 RepID=A0A6B9TSS9_9ROSA|nr:hypothetical protein RF1 [Elatostema laevissimum var. laevissimum]